VGEEGSGCFLPIVGVGLVCLCAVEEFCEGLISIGFVVEVEVED